MPTAKPTDVASYLAAQPPDVRKPLAKARAALRRALPTSVEPDLFATLAASLPGRDAKKGIIRFDLDEALPASALKHIATWAKASTKPATKPRRR